MMWCDSEWIFRKIMQTGKDPRMVILFLELLKCTLAYIT